jgi:hypothetical protein
LLIPPLVVILGVLKDPKDPTKSMSADLAASFILNHIFNHTTMLLLGGYTISTAFSRSYNPDLTVCQPRPEDQYNPLVASWSCGSLRGCKSVSGSSR